MSSQQQSEQEFIERRVNVLVFLPCATASISAISSSLMLFTIYRTRRGTAKRDSNRRKGETPLERSGWRDEEAAATTAAASAACTNHNRNENDKSASVTSSNNTALTTTKTKKMKEKEKNGTALTTYHRLVLGVAVFDIIFSTAVAFGPLPIPSETGFVGAHGSTASCEVQGFMLQLGSGSFAYTTCLILYYLLVIRYGVQDRTMTKHVEPWLHAIPVTFHGSTAVAGLVLDVFNPQGPSRCWVAPYPIGCDLDWVATGNDEEEGLGGGSSSMECSRGAKYTEFFGTYLLVVPLLVYTILSLVFLVVIAFTVWTRYRRSNRHRFSGSANTMSNSKQQMKMVITQCFLYGLAFLNVSVWGMIVTFMEDFAGRRVDLIGEQFWLGVLVSLFLPLQGLFFFLIFIRPRYLALRRDDNDCGRWYAFYTSIVHPVTRSKNRVGGSYNSNRPNQHSSRISSNDAAAETNHDDNEIRKSDDGDDDDDDDGKGHTNNNSYQTHDKNGSFSAPSTTEIGKGI